MKQLAFLLFISFALLAGAQERTRANQGKVKKDAQAAAEKWLALMDSGKYSESYEAAASVFKAETTKKQWIEDNAKKEWIPYRYPDSFQHPYPYPYPYQLPYPYLDYQQRGPVSRRFSSARRASSLPGLPKGEYVVIEFATRFDEYNDGSEVVTMLRGRDGKWRVAAYLSFIVRM